MSNENKVVLPEPVEQVKEVMVLVGKYGSAVEANSTGNPSNYTLASDESAAYAAIKTKLRALLATGGQAQAVGRGEVLVTVSGFTGCGKSAIAGEIEILCRALGLQVDWPDGESEKNMTHADWTAALEQYKPRVRIVEQNIPFVSKKGLSK